MEDDSIKEKQEYLRENILDKGIEANLFAEFLASKRGDAASDISTWSIEELQEAVKEFLQTHGEGQKKNVIIEENNKKDVPNENKNNTLKDGKKEIKSDDQKEEEIKYSPEIYGIIGPNKLNLKKLEETPLSSVSILNITISDPSKIEGGFFSKSYISYLITTAEPRLNVRRRYSDFEWLHQMLMNLYPYLLIPPIPKKGKISSDKFDETFIAQRMRFLKRFLDWLVASPVIKNSKLFYDFLSIASDEEFAKSKIEYQKMDKPMNIKEFHCATKNMDVSVTEEKEERFIKIYNSTINNELLFSNLNFSLKQLKVQFNNLIEQMEDVQKIWEIIYINNKKFSESPAISSIYEKMNKLFTDWGSLLQKQSQLIFVDIREYFKYIKNNFRDMKESLYTVEGLKNDYYRLEKNLINKKEDLYKRGEVEKWEIDPQEKTNKISLVQDKLSALFKMCSKDTKRIVQRKIYYGYYLNQLLEENERIKSYYTGLHKENQMNFCQNLTDIMNDFRKQLYDIMTGLTKEDNTNIIEDNSLNSVN